MSKIHKVPAAARDAFAVVSLAGRLYLDGLFPTYGAAKDAADTAGTPMEITRLSVPIAEDGEHCTECLALIQDKYRHTATNDIATAHEE